MFYKRDTSEQTPWFKSLASQVTTRPEHQLKPDISTFHPNKKPASPPQSDVKNHPEQCPRKLGQTCWTSTVEGLHNGGRLWLNNQRLHHLLTEGTSQDASFCVACPTAADESDVATLGTGAAVLTSCRRHCCWRCCQLKQRPKRGHSPVENLTDYLNSCTYHLPGQSCGDLLRGRSMRTPRESKRSNWRLRRSMTPESRVRTGANQLNPRSERGHSPHASLHL